MAQGSQGAQCCDVYIDFSELSDLCEAMPRRLLVTGVLIQWLRLHFADETNIENDFPQGPPIWTNSIDTTGILIASSFEFNAAQTENRPAVMVRPGAWKYNRMGIADRHTIGANQYPNGPCCEIIEKYTAIGQGSHTIFCIAGEAAEVEYLADEVYRELLQFSEPARATFGLLRFMLSDLGEPAILEEATENFVVPITVSYGIQQTWQICPPSVSEQALLNYIRRRYRT